MIGLVDAINLQYVKSSLGNFSTMIEVYVLDNYWRSYIIFAI